MDGDDGVAAIVLAAEHLLDLGRLDFGLQFVEAAGEVAIDRFALLDPFGEHGEVVAALLQGIAQGDVLFEAAAALQQLLRFGLVRPEVGLADARFDLPYLLVQSCCLKDSSACRRTVSSGPGTAASDRHGLSPQNLRNVYRCRRASAGSTVSSTHA
jgi:hypothetical protein